MTVSILTGDVRERLAGIPDDSIDCVVTSPPYWGLRDYGVEGQLGMEPSLGEHIAVMVGVFEEVRRVLKPSGTLWLNYGDCYAAAPNGRTAADTKTAGGDDRTFRDKPFSTVGPVYGAKAGRPFEAANGTKRRGGGNGPAGATLKPKDLCMVPNRMAIALQDAGWWVRSEIIWGKPNPMPDSSGVFRPATAHEKIFLLTKSGDADVWRARDTGELSFHPDLGEQCPLVTRPEEFGPRWVKLGSFYDAGAVMRGQRETSIKRLAQDIASQTGSTRANGGAKTNGPMKAVVIKPEKQRGHSRRHAGFNDRWDAMSRAEQGANGRLLRNFESDVTELVPPDVMALEVAIRGFSGAHFATFPPALVVPCILAGCPVGGTVLDPFGGAGTTGLVDDRLGRDAILIELNHTYAMLARDRLAGALCAVEADLPPTPPSGGIFDLLEGGGA